MDSELHQEALILARSLLRERDPLPFEDHDLMNLSVREMLSGGPLSRNDLLVQLEGRAEEMRVPLYAHLPSMLELTTELLSLIAAVSDALDDDREIDDASYVASEIAALMYFWPAQNSSEVHARAFSQEWLIVGPFPKALRDNALMVARRYRYQLQLRGLKAQWSAASEPEQGDQQ